MKALTVSVIIPVYQVEDYLSECIESVLAQTYKHLEIILIDDGSSDRSPDICDNYAAQYPNIQVIHKENEGQSSARNTGMKIASGEYLMFLDSDDLLASPDILQHMAARVSDSDIDILTGNFYIYQNGLAKHLQHHHLKGGAYVQTSEFRFYGFYHFSHVSYPWGKLYRREFLRKNHIAFQNFPLAEDRLFNLECYLKNAVYEFTDRPVVLYRQRPDSQTASYHSDFTASWIGLCNEYEKLVIMCHAPKEYQDVAALHYMYGSFFLVNQELIHYKRNHAFRHTATMLKTYVDSPSVSHKLYELSKGKYLQGIPSRTFRFMLRIFSSLLYCQKYSLFILGVSVYYKLHKLKKL